MADYNLTPKAGSEGSTVNILSFSDGITTAQEGETLSIAVTGGGGQSGATGNNLIAGGGVSWVENLDFHVQAATYAIQGATYSSAATDVTLDASDPTDPRIDVIVANTSGEVVVLTGTPASSPEKPDVDPASQLELTFITVAALATEPSVEVDVVYRTNAEWTSAQSGATWNRASTNNPYGGVGDVDIEGTNVTTNQWVGFTAPGSFDPNTQDFLLFRIRSKATWPTTRQLNITLRATTALRGSTVVLRDGTYGFDSSNVTDYQLIQIPVGDFGAGGLSVNNLRMTLGGTGATVGMYLDNIEFQAGISAPSTSDASRMRWRGTYDATVAYVQNDVVVSSNVQYICILPTTGNAPPNTAYWTPTAASTQPAMTYVGGTVLGGAATTISVGSLDLNTDGIYHIEFMVDNASVSTCIFVIQLNGDTTTGNYWTQALAIQLQVVTGFGGNNNNLGSIATGLQYQGRLTMKKNIDGLPMWDWVGSAGATTGLIHVQGSSYKTSTTNVTSVAITSSVASAMPAGSYLRVWKQVTT